MFLKNVTKDSVGSAVEMLSGWFFLLFKPEILNLATQPWR